MWIDFFKTTDDKRKLTKALTPLASKDCKLLMPCDVLNPEILVAKFDGWNDVNELFIADLHRYYFVNQTTMENGGLVRMTLHVDVLYTYADSLKSCNALIDRQEFVFSPYIEDPLLKVRVNRQREVKAIGSFGNPTAGTNYCLITAGTNGGV